MKSNELPLFLSVRRQRRPFRNLPRNVPNQPLGVRPHRLLGHPTWRGRTLNLGEIEKECGSLSGMDVFSPHNPYVKGGWLPYLIETGYESVDGDKVVREPFPDEPIPLPENYHKIWVPMGFALPVLADFAKNEQAREVYKRELEKFNNANHSRSRRWHLS